MYPMPGLSLGAPLPSADDADAPRRNDDPAARQPASKRRRVDIHDEVSRAIRELETAMPLLVTDRMATKAAVAEFANKLRVTSSRWHGHGAAIRTNDGDPIRKRAPGESVTRPLADEPASVPDSGRGPDPSQCDDRTGPGSRSIADGGGSVGASADESRDPLPLASIAAPQRERLPPEPGLAGLHDPMVRAVAEFLLQHGFDTVEGHLCARPVRLPALGRSVQLLISVPLLREMMRLRRSDVPFLCLRAYHMDLVQSLVRMGAERRCTRLREADKIERASFAALMPVRDFAGPCLSCRSAWVTLPVERFGRIAAAVRTLEDAPAIVGVRTPVRESYRGAGRSPRTLRSRASVDPALPRLSDPCQTPAWGCPFWAELLTPDVLRYAVSCIHPAVALPDDPDEPFHVVAGWWPRPGIPVPADRVGALALERELRGSPAPSPAVRPRAGPAANAGRDRDHRFALSVARILSDISEIRLGRTKSITERIPATEPDGAPPMTGGSGCAGDGGASGFGIGDPVRTDETEHERGGTGAPAVPEEDEIGPSPSCARRSERASVYATRPASSFSLVPDLPKGAMRSRPTERARRTGRTNAGPSRAVFADGGEGAARAKRARGIDDLNGPPDAAHCGGPPLSGSVYGTDSIIEKTPPDAGTRAQNPGQPIYTSGRGGVRGESPCAPHPPETANDSPEEWGSCSAGGAGTCGFVARLQRVLLARGRQPPTEDEQLLLELWTGIHERVGIEFERSCSRHGLRIAPIDSEPRPVCTPQRSPPPPDGGDSARPSHAIRDDRNEGHAAVCAEPAPDGAALTGLPLREGEPCTGRENELPDIVEADEDARHGSADDTDDDDARTAENVAEKAAPCADGNGLRWRARQMALRDAVVAFIDRHGYDSVKGRLCVRPVWSDPPHGLGAVERTALFVICVPLLRWMLTGLYPSLPCIAGGHLATALLCALIELDADFSASCVSRFGAEYVVSAPLRENAEDGGDAAFRWATLPVRRVAELVRSLSRDPLGDPATSSDDLAAPFRLRGDDDDDHHVAGRSRAFSRPVHHRSSPRSPIDPRSERETAWGCPLWAAVIGDASALREAVSIMRPDAVLPELGDPAIPFHVVAGWQPRPDLPVPLNRAQAVLLAKLWCREEARPARRSSVPGLPVRATPATILCGSLSRAPERGARNPCRTSCDSARATGFSCEDDDDDEPEVFSFVAPDEIPAADPASVSVCAAAAPLARSAEDEQRPPNPSGA